MASASAKPLGASGELKHLFNPFKPDLQQFKIKLFKLGDNGFLMD